MIEMKTIELETQLMILLANSGLQRVGRYAHRANAIPPAANESAL